VLQQISYIQHKDLGYKKEHVLVFPVDYKMSENYEAIKTAISLDPNIISISGGYDSPTFIQWADGISAETGIDKKKLSVNANPVDLGYVKTMGMQIIAGTDFTRADLQLLDTSDRYKNYRYSFILNEKAVKELGWTPQEAIGKTIEKGAPGTIKAVVKDFHYTSLHEPIKPFVFFLNPAQVRQMFVKISGQNISKALEHLSTVWKQRVAHRPFEYRFLDEEYNSLYTTEQRTAKVFATFSTLAILLACLGLFALTAYTVVQRTKEIGIRKVLGATVPNILAVISKDFIKLVIIAVVIATPVAWYTMHKWLEDFAYRININPAIFVLAALSTLLIALLTVIAQAIKVAIANPVKSLRTE
jgi:putative ABC transport system permease protein